MTENALDNFQQTEGVGDFANYKKEISYTAGSKDAPRRPLPNEWNYDLFLKYHPALAGRFRFNEFLGIIEVSHPIGKKHAVKGYPRELSDEIVTDVARWMTRPDPSEKYAKGGNFKAVGQSTILACIAAEAHRNAYDPLKDHVESLSAWDGVKRLDTWLTEAWGVPSDDYHQFVGRKLIMGMVARAVQPGVKFDYCVIFEGKQGIKKSTMARVLCGVDEWFNDSLGALGNKESFLTIQGSWVCELAELSAMRKSDVESTKQFITSTQDRYRPPYGRNLITVQRRSVFIATTNESDGYLGDRTGNRRFLPVKCEQSLNDEWLKDNREQLLAEALAAFKGGEKLYAEAGSEIIKRVEQEQGDRAAEYIHGAAWAEYLNNVRKPFVTVPEILKGSIDMDPDRITRPIQIELGRFISAECPDWVKKKKRIGGVGVWVFERLTEQGEFDL